MNQNQNNPNQLNETVKGVVALVQIIVACISLYMVFKVINM
jgi:hypothetical protein